MMIDTTIHAHAGLMSDLEMVAIRTGKPVSVIVVLLMKRIMLEHHDLLESARCIRYQKRKNKHEWTRPHISLAIRDYEYFLDMRKLCKMSVSFLIALAAERHLEEILRDLLGSNNTMPDNYLFKHYILIKKIYKDVICWKIYWGVPEDPGILYDN